MSGYRVIDRRSEATKKRIEEENRKYGIGHGVQVLGLGSANFGIAGSDSCTGDWPELGMVGPRGNRRPIKIRDKQHLKQVADSMDVVVGPLAKNKSTPGNDWQNKL